MGFEKPKPIPEENGLPLKIAKSEASAHQGRGSALADIKPEGKTSETLGKKKNEEFGENEEKIELEKKFQEQQVEDRKVSAEDENRKSAEKLKGERERSLVKKLRLPKRYESKPVKISEEDEKRISYLALDTESKLEQDY